MHVTMKLSLPRQPSSVTRARQALTTLLSLTDTDEEVRGHLAVLISEACANAVTHSDPGSTVEVTIVIADSTCQLEISNLGTTPDGSRFNAGLPDPLAVGGRGLPDCPSSQHSPIAPPSPPNDPATWCWASRNAYPAANASNREPKTSARTTRSPKR